MTTPSTPAPAPALARAAHQIWPRHCRLLRTAPDSGAFNMACDTHLMSVARESGDAILRCYAWSRPTVSFGRHERVTGRYTAEALGAAGLSAVRRPTGGRALLHDREVTYSVALPLADQVRWPDAYAAINALLLEALHALGVPARLVERAETDPTLQQPDGPPCFAAPAAGEVAVGKAKLVGSAVWRERGAYLQHGSILLYDDQPRLDALLRASTGDASVPEVLSDGAAQRSASRPGAATLSALLGEQLSWLDVTQALERAATASTETRTWQLTPADVTAIASRQQLYDDPNWLWRR